MSKSDYGVKLQEQQCINLAKQLLFTSSYISSNKLVGIKRFDAVCILQFLMQNLFLSRVKWSISCFLSFKKSVTVCHFRIRSSYSILCCNTVDPYLINSKIIFKKFVSGSFAMIVVFL